MDVFIVGHADERAFFPGGYRQSRGFDVGRKGVVSRLEQRGGRVVRRFARAALDHLHAPDGHTKYYKSIDFSIYEEAFMRKPLPSSRCINSVTLDYFINKFSTIDKTATPVIK